MLIDETNEELLDRVDGIIMILSGRLSLKDLRAQVLACVNETLDALAELDQFEAVDIQEILDWREIEASEGPDDGR